MNIWWTAAIGLHVCVFSSLSVTGINNGTNFGKHNLEQSNTFDLHDGAGKRSKIYYNLNKSMRLARNVRLTDPLIDNPNAEVLDKHDFS